MWLIKLYVKNPPILPVVMTCFVINFYRYYVMTECWQEEPEKRPTFSEVVTVISTILEGMAGYLDLIPRTNQAQS